MIRALIEPSEYAAVNWNGSNFESCKKLTAKARGKKKSGVSRADPERDADAVDLRAGGDKRVTGNRAIPRRPSVCQAMFAGKICRILSHSFASLTLATCNHTSRARPHSGVWSFQTISVVCGARARTKPRGRRKI
jgi:hypothetical protein